MIFVKDFTCAPDRIRRNATTAVLLKFEGRNQSNQTQRPVRITYNIPPDNSIVWQSSADGQIDVSGKNLTVGTQFGKTFKGFKHRANIHVPANETAEGVILDMLTVDQVDGDDDLDSTGVLLL